MALINCPECGKNVSSAAPTCPSCGVPIAKSITNNVGDGTFTIQETGKDLKEQYFISLFLIAIGVVWIIWQLKSGSPGDGQFNPLPFLFVVGGLIWYFVTRSRIWWHHK